MTTLRRVRNDMLDGGAGNDWLEGCTGYDSYLFEAGFGQDAVQHYFTNAGYADTLRFGHGLTLENMRFALSNTDRCSIRLVFGQPSG